MNFIYACRPSPLPHPGTAPAPWTFGSAQGCSARAVNAVSPARLTLFPSQVKPFPLGPPRDPELRSGLLWGWFCSPQDA